MSLLIEGVVVGRGVLAGIPVEDELALVKTPSALSLLLALAQVPEDWKDKFEILNFSSSSSFLQGA